MNIKLGPSIEIFRHFHWIFLSNRRNDAKRKIFTQLSIFVFFFFSTFLEIFLSNLSTSNADLNKINRFPFCTSIFIQFSDFDDSNVKVSVSQTRNSVFFLSFSSAVRIDSLHQVHSSFNSSTRKKNPSLSFLSISKFYDQCRRFCQLAFNRRVFLLTRGLDQTCFCSIQTRKWNLMKILLDHRWVGIQNVRISRQHGNQQSRRLPAHIVRNLFFQLKKWLQVVKNIINCVLNAVCSTMILFDNLRQNMLFILASCNTLLNPGKINEHEKKIFCMTCYRRQFGPQGGEINFDDISINRFFIDQF